MADPVSSGGASLRVNASAENRQPKKEFTVMPPGVTQGGGMVIIDESIKDTELHNRLSTPP
jgi:hypothetical protein